MVKRGETSSGWGEAGFASDCTCRDHITKLANIHTERRVVAAYFSARHRSISLQEPFPLSSRRSSRNVSTTQLHCGGRVKFDFFDEEALTATDPFRKPRLSRLSSHITRFECGTQLIHR